MLVEYQKRTRSALRNRAAVTPRNTTTAQIKNATDYVTPVQTISDNVTQPHKTQGEDISTSPKFMAGERAL